MSNEKMSGDKVAKKPTEVFDPSKEKDLDDLVHETHEPAPNEDVGITKGKDPDDLIHQPPTLVEKGLVPDSEAIPIDDDLEDELRRE